VDKRHKPLQKEKWKIILVYLVKMLIFSIEIKNKIKNNFIKKIFRLGGD